MRNFVYAGWENEPKNFTGKTILHVLEVFYNNDAESASRFV